MDPVLFLSDAARYSSSAFASYVRTNIKWNDLALIRISTRHNKSFPRWSGLVPERTGSAFGNIDNTPQQQQQPQSQHRGSELSFPSNDNCDRRRGTMGRYGQKVEVLVTGTCRIDVYP